MWVGLGAILTAGACEAPLSFRTMVPPSEATAVPVTVQPLLALIGMGDPVAFDLSLTGPEGRVAARRESWCYDHEGPAELHCWVRLVPEAPLAPGTTYRLATRTDDHDGAPFSVQHSFETGAAAPPADPETPLLEVLDAWTPDSSELTECDWDPLLRWELAVTPVEVDASGLSIYQLYHQVGGEDVLVHTLFQHSADTLDVKQYLDGNEPTDHCFAVVQEDGAGGRSAAQTACWREAEPDDSGDPSAHDSGPVDDSADSGEGPASTRDSAAEDSSVTADSGTPSVDLPALFVPDATCRGGCAAAVVPLLWFGALVRRRESQEAAGAPARGPRRLSPPRR